jgi:hypothetical protein
MSTPDLPFDPAKLAGLSDGGFRAPELEGTVEGWRAWRVSMTPPPYGTAPRLNSATFSYYWAPRTLARAECDACGSDVPGEHCSCGFYSAKTLDHLRDMGYHTYDSNTGNVCVVGQLANWGKVIEGSQGWRAEKAYPVVIYVPFEAHRLARPISDAYGVPVRLLNLLDPTKRPPGVRPGMGDDKPGA